MFKDRFSELTVRDGLLASLADNGKSARTMSLLFCDRTFVGDVRSSEMCQERALMLLLDDPIAAAE